MDVIQSTKPSKFSVRYMKKENESCSSCKKRIRKNNLFIVKIFQVSLFENVVAYHSHCFARIRAQLNWNKSAESLIGFDKLPQAAQERLKDLFT